jgi:uncharacterized protein (DUF433 family)
MDFAKLNNLSGTIVSTPGNCGGSPRIEGTRMTVRFVVGLYKAGNEPEIIAARYRNVSLGGVFAALAFYFANREALDAEFRKEEEQELALEREDRERLFAKRLEHAV